MLRLSTSDGRRYGLYRFMLVVGAEGIEWPEDPGVEGDGSGIVARWR